MSIMSDKITVKKPAKVGRPKLIFDLKLVETYGYFKATHDTMASLLDVSVFTVNQLMKDVNSEFSIAYKKGFSKFKLKLSEAQVKCAIEKLNPALLIWLGKQHLEQREPTYLTEEDESKLSEIAAVFAQALVQTAGAGRVPSCNNGIQE